MSNISRKQREDLAAAGVMIPDDITDTKQLLELPESNMDDFERVNANDLDRVAAEESFANDVLTIRVHTTTDKMAPPFAVVTVVGQGATSRLRIPRGSAVNVKRMHVEVLGRMRETGYSQPDRDMMNPESGNALVPSDGLVYPFDVIKDPHPLGREWLNRLMNEPTY